MSIAELRQEYHNRICNEVIRIKRSGNDTYPNMADKGNISSRNIAWGLYNRLVCAESYERISGQTAGDRFEKITKDFIENAFGLLNHLRPGTWQYSTRQTNISKFYQYEHLSYLEKIIKTNKALSSTLGGNYIVKPDIIISRRPVTDATINQVNKILTPDVTFSKLTPLREINHRKGKIKWLLHASISCKWTIRSDRSQNTRTEALNLIRNRKGHLPHVVAVIAEPLPTRISTLALGTGDLDCVYHFALNELRAAIEGINNNDQLDMLNMMIEGRRLRDISDLPFDLAI